MNDNRSVSWKWMARILMGFVTMLLTAATGLMIDAYSSMRDAVNNNTRALQDLRLTIEQVRMDTQSSAYESALTDRELIARIQACEKEIARLQNEVAALR